jgi:hypothetical protein
MREICPESTGVLVSFYQERSMSDHELELPVIFGPGDDDDDDFDDYDDYDDDEYDDDYDDYDDDDEDDDDDDDD